MKMVKLTMEMEMTDEMKSDFEKAFKHAGTHNTLEAFIADYFVAMYENGITNDVMEHAEYKKQLKAENEAHIANEQ